MFVAVLSGRARGAYPSLSFVSHLIAATCDDQADKLYAVCDFSVLLIVDVTSARRVAFGMQLYDSAGKPLKTGPPTPLTAAFCRAAYYQGPTRHEIIGSGDAASTEVRHDLVRAQVPHLVTLLVYRSKLQLRPAEREYFVYAPMDYKSSVKIVMRMWRRWEKPRRREADSVIDMLDDYPKVEDAAVSEPIDDKFFDEMWKATRQRKHLCAGHPNDPFVFTCLDPSVKVFRTEDFQKDLVVSV